jgi:Putative ER transporter, 6TM, N-terminal/Fusaric acid resistance protein-like/Aromatic acid exporter family member 2
MGSATPHPSEEASLPQSSSKNEQANGFPRKMKHAETKSETAAKKPSLLKKAWAKLGLDPITIILMAKGALPPIIALAAYRADAYARQYTTLGYLGAIMATLSLAMQPRAKFLQSILLSTVMTCTGAAVALLQVQCCVAARKRYGTSTASRPGSSGSQQAVEYSSAASVTAGVWLFFTIYLANVLKAVRPQMMLPIIQYCIFTLVASTYAPHFPDMTTGMDFVRRLLITFLTGFAIGTGVCLLVLPMTSRTIALKQYGSILGMMKGALVAHSSFMEAVTDANQKVSDSKGANIDTSDLSARGKALKENMTKTAELFTKVKLEMSFAKKEIAYGKFGPGDYSNILNHLSEIILPLFGMSTFLDIMSFVRDRKERRNKLLVSDETLEAIRVLETEEWIEVMAISKGPFARAKDAFIQGLTHIGSVLEVAPKPKTKAADIEKDAATGPTPGEKGFADYLEQELNAYHEHRNSTIRTWCEKKGIDVPVDFWTSPDSQSSWKDHKSMSDCIRQSQNHQQLYLILYMEYLMYSIGTAILEMARYADSKLEDGTMKNKRFINPGTKRIKNLFFGVFRNKDQENIMTDGDNTGNSVWIGDSLNVRKDPEHLPPKNAWEKSTDHLRAVSKFLGSAASAFGFRAAIATMSIGILAYVRQTYTFFLQQRILWAMIMTAISMDSTTGRGLFGFFGRILGTAVAMVSSICIWYIGYKQPAAIIPVFFIYIMGGFWFLIKNPSLAIIAMINIITAVLIIGYELQETKIGEKATTSNGQPFYEIYILAPYRLGTVCAGLLVAFIWSYFPYPVTTHTTLRKDLGKTLYLLANYYSCVHTTVNMRMKHGSAADDTDNSSPMYKLAKARMKCFSKLIILLSQLREHSRFTTWEPTFGGRFPKEKYDELIDSLQHMFNYISLIAYSSKTFATTTTGHESEWLRDFRSFAGDLQLTSHEMTSILCLVSASVTNAQPLPPYLRIPQPYALAERMESVDPGILSVKHVSEPCYASFAVLEVASSLIVEEVGFTVRKVQDLVGEVDFSFHVVSTMGDDGSSFRTLVGEGQAGKDGKGKGD